MIHGNFFSGMDRVQIECADMAAFISDLGRESIPVYDLRYINDLRATFWVFHKHYKHLTDLAKKKGATVGIECKAGLYWYIKRLLHRPVLISGIGFVLFLSIFIPGRILFITVEGNQVVSARYILECAEACGLSFGADRSFIRSEKIKNMLLERVPQLQWVGVNTSGCVAVISVQEREMEQQKQEYAVSSIIAHRDGVIVSCTGTRGNVLCKPGQAVKRGDVLISGYTDCGSSIRAEQAQGDVYAHTIHSLTVLSPASDTQKGKMLCAEEKYALIIGKNRINFYKDSGILSSGCDMIYKEYYAMLPGGFQLPVAIVKETWYTYDNAVVPASEDAIENYSQEYAQNYLCAQMVGGQILDKDVSVNMKQDVYILNVKYTCLEMIGRIRREEILKGNG